MTFKFALVAAFCVAQAFAVQDVSKPNNLQTFELAQEIPNEFEEADDIRETDIMTNMEAEIQTADPGVALNCLRKQKGPYESLGKKIAGMVDQVATEMSKELGDKYSKYARRAVPTLKTIESTLDELPMKMEILIRNNQFEKSLDVMKKSRRTVEEKSRSFSQITRDLAQENANAAGKADKMANEIRAVARKGYKDIEQAFCLCVTRGMATAQYPAEANIEETPQQ